MSIITEKQVHKDDVELDGGAILKLKSGQWSIDGVPVTADASEINSGDISTAGTVQASKAVVVDANKDIAGFRRVTAGAFASLLKGSGSPLATATPYALAVYTDDVGADISDSVRGILSRTLLTVDQSAGSIRALMGQLKLATGVDVTTGIYTGVQGYVELAGTHSAKTGSTFSCMDASVEIGTALTVDSGGEFAGIHVETTGAGTITNNGTCAGILIDKAAGAASWPVGASINDSAIGIEIGAVTDHAISVTGTWGTGITGAAVSIGDYSNAIAFGQVTEHIVGLCVNLSGSTDDDSNFIPIHGKFATTAACGANAVAQAIYGRVDIAHDVNGSYGVRGAITMTGTPEVNQVFGMFSTMALAGCNLAETGQVAGLAIELTGSEDITTSGSYGKVSGIRIAWEHTNAMTVDTCGIYASVKSGATLDSGYRINTSGALTNAFHSHNTSGTPTNGLLLEGAHTNALALPVAGTAPTVGSASAANQAAEGSIAITIGGVTKYLQYFAATS